MALALSALPIAGVLQTQPTLDAAEVWNSVVVPLANTAVGLLHNTSVGPACSAAPVEEDPKCFVCPSKWYAHCDRDLNKPANETWRWASEHSCNVLGCRPRCADLTNVPGIVGNLDDLVFGCCAVGGPEPQRSRATSA